MNILWDEGPCLQCFMGDTPVSEQEEEQQDQQGQDERQEDKLQNVQMDQQQVGQHIEQQGAQQDQQRDEQYYEQQHSPQVKQRSTSSTSNPAGILNTIPTVIAALECSEAIKILVGSAAVSRTYSMIDVWHNTVDYITRERDPLCPVCGSPDATSE